MRKHLYLFLLLAGLLTACSETELDADPQLVGAWADDFSIYRFNADNTFTIKRFRAERDSMSNVDSLWGKYELYEVDQKEIHFTLTGWRNFRTNQDTTVNQYYQVWKYEINGDRLLYNSKTGDGVLDKR